MLLTWNICGKVKAFVIRWEIKKLEIAGIIEHYKLKLLLCLFIIVCIFHQQHLIMKTSSWARIYFKIAVLSSEGE